MNTIGIDYQRTATVVWVREEARAVEVGDGRRSRIPTAVADPSLWGSQAVAMERHVWGGSDPSRPNPWFSSEVAAQFWSGMRQRLVAFLGRTEPSARNGYPCVITGERFAEAVTAGSILRAVEAAGLERPTLIAATDALFVRWLVDAKPSTAEQTIAVVAVGDATAEVTIRTVRFDHMNVPNISMATPPQVVGEVGHALLLQSLLRLVRDRLKQPLRATDVPVLHDAAIEFAQSLASGATRWTGPLRDRMYTPPAVSLEDLQSWPEAKRAAKELPAAFAAALAASKRNRVDVLVLGGTGAAWPHFAEILMGRAKQTWTSGDPTNDLAYGAAWFPVYADRLTPIAAPLPPLAHTVEAPTPSPPVPSQNEGEIPPWERDG